VTTRVRRILIAVAIVGTIGCDRLTKHLAERRLPTAGTLSYAGDTLRVRYIENAGGFLGLGSQLPSGARFVLLVASTSVVLVLCAFMLLRRGATTLPEALAWALVLAGGTSNLVDRIWRGGWVVDFLNVGLGPVRTGIFNVADMAITTGVVLLLLSRTKGATPHEITPPQSAP
jgi:signal peptidase II